MERGLPNGTRLSIEIKVSRLLKIMEPTSLNMSSQSEDIQGNIIANVEIQMPIESIQIVGKTLLRTICAIMAQK